MGTVFTTNLLGSTITSNSRGATLRICKVQGEDGAVAWVVVVVEVVEE